MNKEVLVCDQEHTKTWSLYNADCVDVARGLPDNSIHFTCYSPPFESLYTFSDNPRDISNNSNPDVFWEHYRFLIREMVRSTMPGRLIATHCMQLPTSKTRDGFIGMRDFRGEIIRAFQGNDAYGLYDAMQSLLVRASQSEANGDMARAYDLRILSENIQSELLQYPGDSGMIFHSEVMIRKDPVSAMQRSKSIGLLHKQICKDSSMSRMAAADYMIMMRKPGENTEPVSGPFDAYYGDESPPEGPLRNENSKGVEYLNPGDDWFSVAVWQRYAESVWTDINQGDVLTHKCAREESDERHISPLQLTPIRRCIDLWSNPGDVVFSPFAGIGSELYCAVEMGRKAIGSELKESYYNQAVANLKSINNAKQLSILDGA